MRIFQKTIFIVSLLLFINAGCTRQVISNAITPTSITTVYTVSPTDYLTSTPFPKTLTPHFQRTTTKIPLTTSTILVPDLSQLIIDDQQLLDILEEADATLDQNGLMIISPQGQSTELRVAAIVQETPTGPSPAQLIIELVYHPRVSDAKQNSAKYRAEKEDQGFKEIDVTSFKNYPQNTWMFVKDNRVIEINTIYHQYEIRIRMQSSLIGKEDTAVFTDSGYFVDLLLEIDNEQVKKLEIQNRP